MEPDEAAKRILRHPVVLIVCVGVAMLVPILLLQGRGTLYVATTRILVTDIADKTASASAADAVAAIATSPAQIGVALHDAGLQRDPDGVIATISSRSIGTSGIVELSLGDRDPAEAAALANAMTDRVVQVLRDAREAAYPLPIVIDRAQPATTRAVAPVRPQDVALASLLGLLLGTGIAALLETFRPTLVGEDAIAAHLGVPVLGVLPGPPEEGSRGLAWVRWQLGAQADRKGVSTVQLTTVGPKLDLHPLRCGLRRVSPVSEATVTKTGGAAPIQDHVPHLKIRILDQDDVAHIHVNGRAGLVVVAPTAVRREDIEPLRNLLAVTGWFPIGLIAYRRSRVGRWIGRPDQGAEVRSGSDG